MGNLSVVVIPALSVVTLIVVSLLSRFARIRPGRVGVVKQEAAKNIAFRYIRKILFAVSLIWALILYLRVAFTVPVASYGLSLLVRYFALTGLFLLYAVLTPGLVLVYFPRFSWNSILIRARRSLGISVFFFALLHSTIAFFVNLSGRFVSVLFLSPRNQTALFFSSSAFIIFSLLAITSIDAMEKSLGKRWKQLHRLVYFAALLTLAHAFLIGSHFTDPSGALPLFIQYLSLTYILLEVVATAKRRLMVVPDVSDRKNIPWWIMLSFIAVSGICMSVITIQSRYDPHAAHKKGYSKNYLLSMTAGTNPVKAGEPVQLTFRVTDVRNGATLKRYQTVMEKLMHVVVVRGDLLSYDHIHPEYDGQGTFSISHVFPADGLYTLYAEYSPPDFYENVSIATIQVGKTSGNSIAHLSTGELKKNFGDIAVALSYKQPVRVNDTVDFTFTLTDAKTGTMLSDIEPYLGAFGHMSAVSENLLTYAHVHPIQIPLSSSDHGGPQIQFSTFFPKPGFYKLFTQFKRNNTVFVTDFVVEVK